MRVKSCVASDGSGHIIKLTDEYGCVLRPKMISRFLKARAPNEKATVITYAFFHAFKFPDALSVHIKCKVEICRHGCLDHCQLTGNVHERKDTLVTGGKNEDHDSSNDIGEIDQSEDDRDIYYDDVLHNRDELASLGALHKNMAKLKQINDQTNGHQRVPEVHEETDDIPNDQQPSQEMLKTADDQFPHGPRYLEGKDRMGLPAVAGPRSLNLDNEEIHLVFIKENGTTTNSDVKRQKRSIVVSDRKARSADVGVSGVFDVISEADLAFSPDSKHEPVTVFQGKITEEIVYGICMPVPGFSVLFIVVVSAAIISALIAGSLLYRYQLQKEVFESQKNAAVAAASTNPSNLNQNTIASWMTLRLFRMRQNNATVTAESQSQ